MDSIKELRKICQNPKDYHNPRSFFHNRLWRPFSIYLTKLLLYTPLKPNHITSFMIFLGFLAGFLFSGGTYWYMLAGAIFLEFLYLLDAVDGEMARYKKMYSLNGIFLDMVAHLTNLAIPFIGMTVGLFRSNPSIYIILAGLLASVFSILCLDIQPLKHHVFFKKLINYANKTEQIKSKRISKKEITKEPTEKNILKLIGKTLNYLYDETYIIQIIFLAAIFNKIHWVLYFYGITFPLMWLIKLIHEYRIGYKSYEYLLNPYKK